MLVAFDEESCRSFLHQVGEDVVPFFPFSFGIEKVYALLFDRYGKPQIADAVSVLHELLEDENNANGVGDDGDIWRSWRHHWRHRDDGPLNPSLPRVGGYMLPLPTLCHIRLEKAAKFRALQGGFPCVHREDTSHVEFWGQRLLQSQDPDQQKIRDKHQDAGNDGDSQQDFEDVSASDSMSGNDSQIVSFVVSPSGFPLHNLQAGLRGEDILIYSLRQLPNPSRSNQRPSSLEDVGPGCSGFGNRDMLGVDSLRADLSVQESAKTEGRHLLANVQTPHQPDAYGSLPSNNLNRNSSTESHPLVVNNCKGVLRCSTGGNNARFVAQSAANRLVSLVDGVFFSHGNHFEHKSGNRFLDNGNTAHDNNHRVSFRPSQTDTSPPQNLRRSWVGRLHSLFEKGQQRKKCLSFRENPSSYAPNTSTMRASSISHPKFSFEPQQSRNQATYNFSLDGACDQADNSPSKSPINLGKALPLLPDGTVSDTPLSVGTETLSFADSQETADYPTTVSSVYSNLSRTSSKAEFKSITRGLVHPEMTWRKAAMSPVQSPDMYLNPPKYDPGNPPKSPTTPTSFTSITNASPFFTNEPQSPSYIPPPLSLNKNRDPAKHSEGRGMPQSRSEPSLHGFDGQKEAKTAQYYVPVHLKQPPSRKMQAKDSSEAEGSSRGRSVNRTGSPGKALQDVKENEVLEVKTSPRKRSKSPIKRFLGIGKSASLKDIAGEPQAQAREDLPERGRGNGLKVWGDKIKHGFLTTSESKPDTKANRGEVETTPPSRPPDFPISLEPPYQGKLYFELELMLCVTANTFLVREYKAGRVSAESIHKIKAYWTSKNRPKVVGFLYDQMTQRDLVLYNLTTLKFHGECAENPLVLNATMYSWKLMAKEMSVRTFCNGDSMIRKHMHDTHKILEMMGTPLVTYLAFQELQLKTLAKINEKTRAKEEKRMGSSVRSRDGMQTPSAGTMQNPSRKSSREEQQLQHSRKSSGEEKIVVEDGFDNSRDVRLGLMVRRDGHS